MKNWMHKSETHDKIYFERNHYGWTYKIGMEGRWIVLATKYVDTFNSGNEKKMTKIAEYLCKSV